MISYLYCSWISIKEESFAYFTYIVTVISNSSSSLRLVSPDKSRFSRYIKRFFHEEHSIPLLWSQSLFNWFCLWESINKMQILALYTHTHNWSLFNTLLNHLSVIQLILSVLQHQTCGIVLVDLDTYKIITEVML